MRAMVALLGFTLISSAHAERIALYGTVVTPRSESKSGRIVIDGNTIVCVGSRCSTKGAKIIKTGLDLFAGFVDAHNHVAWNFLPFKRFTKPTYNNRYNWRFGDAVFKDMQRAKGDLEKKLKCDLTVYGEAMAALGGTTTLVSEDVCWEGGIRNAEQPNLGGPAMKTVGDPLQLRGKSRTFWDQVLANPTPPLQFVIHLSEGKDASSLAELAKLEAMGPAYAQNRVTSIVHGIPYGPAEFVKLAQRGWSIIWSPSSNMRLYQRTTDVVTAVQNGVNVAVAPDWNAGGSPTLLQELAYVRRLFAQNAQYRSFFTGPRLLHMATGAAAVALGLGKYIGALAKGYRADVVGIRRSAGVTSPYENLVAGDPRSVELVLVDGRAVVVSSANQALAGVPLAGPCEPVDVCGASRHVCFQQSITAVSARIRAAYPQAAPLADCGERPLQ